MRFSIPCCLALVMAVPAFPKAPAKPKTPVKNGAQAQIKKLTEERDTLKSRLAATESLQEDVASARQSRDLARQELEASRKELAELKASMRENQSGGESLLQDLQKAKAALATCQDDAASAKKDLEELRARQSAGLAEGTLVILGKDIQPARPMNIRNPIRAKKVDRGVVVVNVLVSEGGEVLDARLIQSLPGSDAWTQKANEACVEAAKRLVFDPARSVDGKTTVKVWQGVGFLVE